MKVGYARVSTEDQNLNMQEDALKSAGCEEISSDVASGAKSQRHGLDKALNYVREGDTLVVWKLDRLGRSIHI
jgi:DNA invertase Pin-like site-specific DNA recombinase